MKGECMLQRIYFIEFQDLLNDYSQTPAWEFDPNNPPFLNQDAIEKFREILKEYQCAIIIPPDYEAEHVNSILQKNFNSEERKNFVIDYSGSRLYFVANLKNLGNATEMIPFQTHFKPPQKSLLLIDINPESKSLKKTQKALFQAVERGDSKAVERILSTNPEINLTDLNLIVIALKNTHINIAEYLISKGAKIHHLVLWDCIDNHTQTNKIIQFFLNHHLNIDQFDSETGQTTLHKAVNDGDFSFVKQLIESKANIDARDYEQRTPLHLAAQNGNAVNIMGYLLEKNADIYATDFNGHTAYQLACQFSADELDVIQASEMIDFQEIKKIMDNRNATIHYLKIYLIINYLVAHVSCSNKEAVKATYIAQLKAAMYTWQSKRNECLSNISELNDNLSNKLNTIHLENTKKNSDFNEVVDSNIKSGELVNNYGNNAMGHFLPSLFEEEGIMSLGQNPVAIGEILNNKYEIIDAFEICKNLSDTFIKMQCADQKIAEEYVKQRRELTKQATTDACFGTLLHHLEEKLALILNPKGIFANYFDVVLQYNPHHIGSAASYQSVLAFSSSPTTTTMNNLPRKNFS